MWCINRIVLFSNDFRSIVRCTSQTQYNRSNDDQQTANAADHRNNVNPNLNTIDRASNCLYEPNKNDIIVLILKTNMNKRLFTVGGSEVWIVELLVDSVSVVVKTPSVVNDDATVALDFVVTIDGNVF
jgi:hypothetical protein